jgi:phosphoribosyl 1,2-cyclic phosphodiesterase
VYALASGSSGNATLVKAPGVNILIDAGLGIRKLSSLLHGKGVNSESLSAILVTHEHRDHITGLGALSRRCKAPVVANRSTLQACALQDPNPFETIELPVGEIAAFGSVTVESFPVPHDAVSPVGYIIRYAGAKVTYFTDAGSVNHEMTEALVGANLAVVESNHDVEWLRRGPYTPEMKERVRSSTGHLSNDDCADLIANRLESGGPLTVWLAHLSSVNNSPSLARRSVEARIKSNTRVDFSLAIALRDSPSVEWRAAANRAGGIQLNLF